MLNLAQPLHRFVDEIVNLEWIGNGSKILAHRSPARIAGEEHLRVYLKANTLHSESVARPCRSSNSRCSSLADHNAERSF